MRRRRSNNVLAAVMIIYIIAMGFVFFYVHSEARDIVTSKATTAIGYTRLCINHPPVLAEDCPINSSVYSLYRCDTNGTDEDNNTITFSDSVDFFEIGNESGDVIFVPNDSIIGNNSVVIYLSDNLGCSNSVVNSSFYLSVYSTCGDGICSSDESYSSCSADCDRPYEGPSSPSSGAGAPRGGLSTKIRPSFVMKPEIILKSIAPGGSDEETVVVSNNGTQKTAIVFSVEGVDEFISLSDPGFTLNKKDRANLKVKFVVPVDQKLGTYVGKIVGKASGLEKTVALILEVESSSTRFDLSLLIPQEYLTVDSGDDLVTQITIFDILKGSETEADIRYTIRDLENNLILDKKETVTIDKQLSYQKMFTIPERVSSGIYVLSAELSHKDQLIIESREFEIVGTGVVGFRSPVDALGEYRLVFVAILAMGLGGGAIYWLWITRRI